MELVPGVPCDLEFDLQLDLTSTGSGVTGTAITTLRKQNPLASNCGAGPGAVQQWPLLTNGVVGPGSISFSLPGPNEFTINFSGTFTATRMTGTVVTSGPGAGPRRGTFALNRQ